MDIVKRHPHSPKYYLERGETDIFRADLVKNPDVPKPVQKKSWFSKLFGSPEPIIPTQEPSLWKDSIALITGGSEHLTRIATEEKTIKELGDDPAMQALKLTRTTNDEKLLKEIRRLKKAPQEITLKIPRDVKLNALEKKEVQSLLNKVLLALVAEKRHKRADNSRIDSTKE